MIGLGAKYLTAAGFGRYRITAASLGNLDLLGTFGWLTKATKQAILGAFGDDGVAVINATNAYLNGIAASDRDKATALAGFINEDPMMVCSLGLEVEGVYMPWRFLKGNGTAYFDMQETVDTTAVYTAGMKADTSETNAGFMVGCRSASSTQRFQFQLWRGDRTAYTALQTTNVNSGADWTQHHILKADIAAGKTWVDDVQQMSGVTGSYSSAKILLFTIMTGSNVETPSLHYMSFYKKTKNGEDVKWLVPFNDGGTAKFINLVASMASGTKVFETQQGTGSFTIPDISYTPSTP